MSLPRAGGEPALAGVLRSRPEDFIVEELLPFAPAGEGEHLLVRVEKTGANTDWVAGQLARQAGVRRGDVGYAGRKDRHATARQWFSIWLPGKPDIETAAVRIEGLRILELARHTRKLKPGSLSGNRFDIVVRELEGEASGLAARVEALRAQGAPNYFGVQRFGRNGRNLELAETLFAGGARLRRNERSLALSAARAEIFNAVLAARVLDDTWQTALPGDCLNLDGSRSFFRCDVPDADIAARIGAGDLHISGPLWGEGELPSAASVRQLETTIAERYPTFAAGLAGARLRQERRALRIVPRELQVSTEADTLRARFVLPAGAFATSVLAQLVAVANAAGV